jgi:hypothetical protein
MEPVKPASRPRLPPKQTLRSKKNHEEATSHICCPDLTQPVWG